MKTRTTLHCMLSYLLPGRRHGCTLFVVLFSFHVFSQNSPPADSYKFLRLGEAQGLAHPKVTSIFQDSYGFIWIGTQGGLQRFDGNQFTTYEHIPGDPTSLPGNYIAYHAFHEDKNSDLWIASFNNGFVKFDRRTEKFQTWQAKENKPNWLTSNELNALCGDGQGGLWVGTRGRGLCHFSPKDNVFKVYLSEKKDTLFGSKGIVSLLRATDGTLWIAGMNGLAILDKQGNFRRFFPHPAHPDSLSDDFIPDVFEDQKGRIWVATQNGLNLVKPDGSFQRFFPESHPNVPKGSGYNYILRVFEDIDGTFWLGTTGGLLRFDPERNDYLPIRHNPLDPTSIGKGNVHGIVQDRSGNLWFATDEGISILDKKTALLNCSDWSMVQEMLPSVSSGEGVLDLAQTGNRFWFSAQKGLFTFKKGGQVNRFLEGSFTQLFLDKNGRLLAGTVMEKSWFIIDPTLPKVLEIKGKEQDFPRRHRLPYGMRQTSFAQDRQGNIWMGTYYCLNRCDPELERCFQFHNEPNRSDDLPNATVNDLLLDRQGNLWIATNGGLGLLPATELAKPLEDTTLRFTNFRHDPTDPASLSNDLVRALFEDSRGQIWAATEVGLNLRLPNGTWQRFLKKDGLPENKITGITEDPEGIFWLSTPNNGLSKFDWEKRRFFNLTEKDGLNTRRFYSGASLRTDDGLLVFAGYGGVNCFDPKQIDFQPESPPLYFTDFKINNQSLQIGAACSPLKLPPYMSTGLVLPFSKNNLSIVFSALDFTAPERQVYRYRLEGFDENWQELPPGKREVTFTNLFPSHYRLRVQTTADGDWGHAAESTLSLRILPPWWLQWWAISMFALLLAAVIYGLYKIRLRQKLAAAETRRLQELDSVKTRLYTNITHEFRTPLTLILGMAERLQGKVNFEAREGLQMIRRNGRQLLNLVNQMLDLAKLEGGSLKLNMVQYDVVLFLKYLLESFQTLAVSKNIELRFEAEQEAFFMDFDAERLRQIVSNLLSNAVKFTPPGGEVRLGVWLNPSSATDLGLGVRLNPSSATDLGLGVRLNPSSAAELGSGVRLNPSSATDLGLGVRLNPSSAAELGFGDTMTLTVTDTGKGIPPEKLPFIFDRFYQADDSATRHAEGTGIGLTLTQELVKLLGGTIEVQSEVDKGTTFKVRLPVTRNASFAEVAAFERSENLLTPNTTRKQKEGITDTSLPTLLLVEDNDDVRRYVEGILKNEYSVEVAPNGKAGLEKALALSPDLILSDVMMPEMDGYELLRALKNDLRTSHIPVVLLTAKADFDSRMEGLEVGAEAYLAKPFEERELRLVLRKLLENRELLRRHYTSGEFLAAVPRPVSAQSANRSEVTANPRDEQFLKEVLEMVHAHLDDFDLTADGLADLLHVAYSNLYKKVKALTGMGVTEYIRHIRLHRAAQLLLEQPDWTVTHISLEVGFNSVSFFNREFKKVFGQSPTGYRQGRKG